MTHHTGFLMFALLTGGAAASATATTRPVDPIAALIREYARAGASEEYFLRDSDQVYRHYVLTNPDSPYSDEAIRALPEPDEPTRRAMAAASTPDHPVSQRDLHEMKVWDLGLKKARFGYDIHWLSDEFRHLTGATGAMKAGVEPDIYKKALARLGRTYPAIAANYGLAAQILRSKLASTPRQQWKEHGLREDVLDRFLQARGADELYDYDLHYLIQLLDGAMATWDVGHQSTYGLRELPAIFRVGRLAGAFRDRLPYEHPPCLSPSGKFDPAHAGQGGVDTRPLCFADATDRAVHGWYVVTLRAELAAIRNGGTAAMQRVAAPLRSSRQGWIGIRRDGVMKMASRKEVVEAKIANKLLFAGELSYRDAFEASRHALRLSCSKEEL
ncbi:MAG TPA: hypothetical protein VN813_07340 [Luteibacter sp.]|nr:hypothetical protein [Luteibacter sp.]